ncbi:ABC transporter ATP-binding protein [Halobaculum sp. EA56]|uniref:ABC transporter ATP-binding protein n=1 Tax=Halobaculum sp. EA56 TaxID=3421648 RepID=UPI003EBC7A89
MSLLSVSDLRTVFETREGTLPAVDGVSFEIEEGETLGLVGESGSGKSVTALSAMGLVESPGRIESGSVTFDGRDMLDLTKAERREVLGEDMSMIFQRPKESLNPVFRIGNQISETLRVHGYDEGDPWEKAVSLLETVGIPAPEENAKKYPHQYSGGMAQRAMIAIAIARNPKLLIADEPTTALDVTIEAQILELLDNLKRELGMSMLFISHDLGVVWEVCDRVAVMYMGKVVEVAETESLFTDPQHPYTEGLLQCLPQSGRDTTPIRGSVPSATDLPGGCSFHPRCPHADEACRQSFPAKTEANGHEVACYLHGDVDEDGARPPGSLPARRETGSVTPEPDGGER